LSRRTVFARNIALRYRSLFNTKYWLTGNAIENEHVAAFRNCGNGRNLLSIDGNIDECGRRRHVVIPQVVMRQLEIPFHFPGNSIERDYRTAEEIVPRSVSAIVIVRTGRIVASVNSAPLFVEAHRELPVVASRTILPCVALPRVVREFTRLRYRME